MLSRDLTRYINQKRSLGFKFSSQDVVLRSFVTFATERGDRYIRNARVLAWAAQASSPEHRRTRLLTVRRFALTLHAENVRHQVPATDALGQATAKRRTPYIYSPQEIARLLCAAAACDGGAYERPGARLCASRGRALAELCGRGRTPECQLARRAGRLGRRAAAGRPGGDVRRAGEQCGP